MNLYGIVVFLPILIFICVLKSCQCEHNPCPVTGLSLSEIEAQCPQGRSATFSRWSGVSPGQATPVFVYSASGEEDSLTGACLAQCRELEDCAAVVVMYTRGNCHGVAATNSYHLKVDNDAAFYRKICLPLSEECRHSWWSLENTPGYHLHSDGPYSKTVLNVTMRDCNELLLLPNREKLYRSAQWTIPDTNMEDQIKSSDNDIGTCVLNTEDKFTEPESYRVSNYNTVYMENQCRHDYLKKIDRCSYEEYYNQTLKHVEFTYKNYTKDECKRSCEIEDRFICRGFTWRAGRYIDTRGICDLHSEDLVTTGSWLLRRTSGATYYRRVICLNVTVECEGSDLIVTYRPRGAFRGRVYVPGHGERCSARAVGGVVRLVLPVRGDCDVNYAYGVSNGPDGVVNRTMAYVMVMIQNNPIIQTAGDRWLRVGCSPARDAHARLDATLAVSDNTKPSSISSPSVDGVASGGSASSAVYGGAAPLTMYVVRADDTGGAGARSARPVALGETLDIRVETTETVEIEAYHLVASSRLGDSSVLLLDSRGCPTGQVDFPRFTRSWRGDTQRLSARFKAFRFPTSHVVRFSLMIRFCDNECPPVNCGKTSIRSARQTNDTYYQLTEDSVPASVYPDVSRDNEEAPWKKTPMGDSEGVPWKKTPLGGKEGVPLRDIPYGGNVVAQGGSPRCGGIMEEGRAVPLEVEMFIDSNVVLSTDTLVRADHRSNYPESNESEPAVVCVHELLLVALALTWLAVQILLLLGCCVLVKRYRNLAELSMSKEYSSFDNIGFDAVSTHRRVHWPDQNIDLVP